ncbi:uncharacterized protein LOC142617162 isoform X2 [Castanea sativa]|uniref:uncharacterized protein LOC142617162 isoform X2 n=2 Tax=Castanea sativa TaxID=21020 RepID=UPI003F65160F
MGCLLHHFTVVKQKSISLIYRERACNAMREKFDGPATAFLVFCHCHTFRTITALTQEFLFSPYLDQAALVFGGLRKNFAGLKTTMLMVGEIEGNDYNYALLQGKTIEEVRRMVLEIVQAIKDVVTVKAD